MSLRDDRNQNREAVLQGRYVSKVLQHNADELSADIDKRVTGFTSEFWDNRSFLVKENRLTYTHLKAHRYIDMKSRNTLRGKRRKRYYAIHNRPLYGHANEIVKDLTVGYTDAVRQEMMELDGTQL